MNKAIILAMSACAALVFANDPVLNLILRDIGLEVRIVTQAVEYLVDHFNTAGFFS